MNQKKIRIAYLSGPVDARNVYKSWKYKEELENFGTSYLSQFFDYCEEIKSEAFIITNHAGETYREKLGRFTILNKPNFIHFSGINYHIGELYWTLYCLIQILKFRPDLVVATAAQNYWFCLNPLFWFGIPVLPSVHNIYIPKFAKKKAQWTVYWFLNRNFFWRYIIAAMGVSSEIARELGRLTDKPIYTFLPTYRREDFDRLERPSNSTPFRIFFAGRIEENKGVFDLLEIASTLEKEAPGSFVFDVCGDGSAMQQLRQANNTPNFHIYGSCNPKQLLDRLSKSSIVVVPTKSTFEEGFNKVCAEAVLSSRPVVTSAACPALELVKPAAIEVRVDNVQDYKDAIVQLKEDTLLFENKINECDNLKEQFYDENKNYYNCLKNIINKDSKIFT